MQYSNKSQPEILVVGSTGKTGRRVVQRLKENGIDVREGSRTAELPFDWDQPTSWEACLNGIKSVYLTFFPDLAVPTAPEAIESFCQLAKTKGIEHITLLSGRGESAAQQCEKILQDSGIGWTIIRSSWFDQNFSEGFFRDYVMSGVLAFPIDGVKEPFVDIDDIAEIAVASLIKEGHVGELYEVTGPELLSFADLADKFTDHVGNVVKFVEISLEEFEKSLTEVGAPADAIAMLKYLFVEVLDGRNEYLTDGIERALDRKPNSFDQFMENNSSCFQQ